MKRIFIAVKTLPGSSLMRMLATVKSLAGQERIKWVDPSNLHITLVFLGDTEEKRIADISHALGVSCQQYGSFEFSLEGTGVFKTWNDPRVFWVGVNPREKLQELNRIILDNPGFAGFSQEERIFRPHLTIGRARSVSDRESLRNILGKYSQIHFQTVKVTEVILYESILQKTGPVYRPLEYFPLKDTSGGPADFIPKL